MITKPTCIILGAGASMSYHYPSGMQLLKSIHQNLSNHNSDWFAILNKCGIDAGHIEDFRNELYLSQASSIDSFLENRREFITVGKLIIAISLIPHEISDSLLNFDARRNGCYQHILSNMTSGCPFSDFGQNNIAFITFNYDRSLEHYLHTALISKYGKTTAEVATVLNKIPIIHVHGMLDRLPWQVSQASGFGRPYSESHDAKEMQSAADQIIIVFEGKDTSEEFQEASNLLKGADRIYFLGFGYNDTNLRRLKIDELPRQLRMQKSSLIEPHMRGSTLGLHDAEIKQIQSKWRIHLPSETGNCLRFLLNCASLS